MDVPKGFKPKRNLDDEVERLKEGYKKIKDEYPTFFDVEDTSKIPEKVTLLAEKDKLIYCIVYNNIRGQELSTLINVTCITPSKREDFDLDFKKLVRSIADYHLITRKNYSLSPQIYSPSGTISLEIRLWGEPPQSFKDLNLAITIFYKKEFDNVGIKDFD